MKIEAFSNGLGAQSMVLGYLASAGRIPAALSITADTGGENDCLWSTGERTTLRFYYETVAQPVFAKWGIDAAFVRSVDRNGKPLPSIDKYHEITAPKFALAKMPLFGSNDGRLKQSCTHRWKQVAIKQEARRRGATHLRTAQGIHLGEAARRVKGLYVGKVGGFDTYHDTVTTKDKNGNRVVKAVKWLTHYYPLVDLRMNRQDCQQLMEKLDIPYLTTTECDRCPHKDAARWLRSSEETIESAAAFESLYHGTQFLTDRRKPLLTVINEFKAEAEANPRLFDNNAFDCTSGLCGVG